MNAINKNGSIKKARRAGLSLFIQKRIDKKKKRVKTKGRTGWHQATSNTSKCAYHSTAIKSRLKATFIMLTLLGWFSICLANRDSKRGGQYDD